MPSSYIRLYTVAHVSLMYIKHGGLRFWCNIDEVGVVFRWPITMGEMLV
jgi:hypothetical protein